MRSEAPVPTVGQVVAVVDAQLGSGLLRCLVPGCGGRLAGGGLGAEGDLVGLGGVTGRVRPRRALCAGCGVSRVLLPDSMLRRRQYGVEVIWAALLAAVGAGEYGGLARGGGAQRGQRVVAGVEIVSERDVQVAGSGEVVGAVQDRGEVGVGSALGDEGRRLRGRGGWRGELGC